MTETNKVEARDITGSSVAAEQGNAKINGERAHQPEAREYDPRAVAVIKSFIKQKMTHKEARAVFREAQILLYKLGDSTQLAAGPLSSILK